MMGQGFTTPLIKNAIWFLVVFFGIDFILGGLTVWGLPKLWHVVKPWIHSLTN